MKQTAVEWLETQFQKDNLSKEILNVFKRAFEQAKEMEKEQIIQARTTAPIISTIDMIDYVKESEQYYNKTFKSE